MMGIIGKGRRVRREKRGAVKRKEKIMVGRVVVLRKLLLLYIQRNIWRKTS
jgi:hypothetical protein